MLPATVGSLLLKLAIFSQSHDQAQLDMRSPQEARDAALGLLGWEHVHMNNPRWVIVEGCYGAAYGPHVRLIPEFCRSHC